MMSDISVYGDSGCVVRGATGPSRLAVKMTGCQEELPF